MKRNLLSLLLLVMIIVLMPLILTEFGMSLVTEIFVMAIFAMSLGLIIGYAGLVSLGHAAFFGFGAYMVALLGDKISNTYLMILAALILTGMIALLTGAVFIRTSNFSFLMITLAFGQLLFALAWKLDHWTGGADGKKVSASLDFGFGEVHSSLGLYYAMAIAFLVIFIFLRMFVQSPAGKMIRGTKENESRMKALGNNIRYYKLIAYSISGAIAGFAGALYAYFNSFVSPDVTSWMLSGQVLLMVIIGGVGTLLGPALGAGIFILLQNFISTYTESWPLIMGVLLVILVLFGRGGVVHLFEILGDKWLKKRKATDNQTPSSSYGQKEVMK